MTIWTPGDTITAEKLNYFGFQTGDLKLTARITPPDGWLLCDGAAISRTTYVDLFNAIGTAYGVGDGSTTFNVPDFLGRAVIGSGNGSGLTSRARGDKSGFETHQLTIAEIPAHVHTGGATWTSNFTHSTGAGQHGSAVDTGSVGGDTVHNNMQPYGVATYIIKT